MTIRQIQKVRGLDQPINRMQDNIINALQPLLTSEINYGIIIKDIILDGTNPVSVDHRLGRQPQGWFIVDITAASGIFREAWDTRTITLNASAATTISIYLF